MPRLLERVAGVTVAVFSLFSSAQGQLREQRPLLDWRTFVVPDFGTTIQYPASIFAPAGNPEKGIGQADGQAVLSIYSRPNESGENPTTYLRNNLRMERSALDYVRDNSTILRRLLRSARE
jgi:hypothetical protein